MADGHEWWKIEGTEIQECVVAGVFAPQGAGAPIIISPTEGVWTVTRFGAGAYNVLFKNGLARLLNFHSAVCGNGAALLNVDVENGLIVNGTAINGGTQVGIRAFTPSTGVGVEIAANGNNLVSFWAVFSNDGSQSLRV